MQTEIPRIIREQENEIESIFRNLVRIHDRTRLLRALGQPDGTRQQEVSIWIGIAVLGFLIIVNWYVLWLKTGADCTLHQVLRESVTSAMNTL